MQLRIKFEERRREEEAEKRREKKPERRSLGENKTREKIDDNSQSKFKFLKSYQYNRKLGLKKLGIKP
jgi:hypothetical protein